ncbi:MAG: cytochrome c biogenesis protein ResB [Verrucomicrobiales bacterium]|nr:cytochrome c biogenesis protein ResB [Verrucomicrobiales bacterium]
MNWLFRPLASLKLTIVLLTLSMVLVFLGTMAQEPLGLYLAQARFFQSAFVDLAAMTAAVKKTLQMIHVYLPPSTAADVMGAPFIPVFPGGYLLGSLLLINLIAAHVSRFQLTRKKAGIVLVHLGMILLLVGQLMTDLVARESAMRLTEGQTRSYSESDRRSELAIADVTSAEKDRVVAFPDGLLSSGAVLEHAELPFKVRVARYYENSMLTNRTAAPNAPAVTEGPGTRFVPLELPKVTVMDMRDVPSAFVEVTGPEGVIGSYLLTEFIERPQALKYKDRNYELSLRLRRYYKDFSLTLLDFRHDKYLGTEIPKNFSSDVRLRNASTGEDRTVKIYMNNPLRYQGLTFYQASFDPRDERVTILQVVRNPAWLTPYFACIVVGLGLVLQFGIHLVGFIRKRASGAGTPPPSAAVA